MTIILTRASSLTLDIGAQKPQQLSGHAQTIHRNCELEVADYLAQHFSATRQAGDVEEPPDAPAGSSASSAGSATLDAHLRARHVASRAEDRVPDAVWIPD